MHRARRCALEVVLRELTTGSLPARSHFGAWRRGVAGTEVHLVPLVEWAPLGAYPREELGGRDTLQAGSKHQPRAFMPDFAPAGLTHHHPQRQLINAT